MKKVSVVVLVALTLALTVASSAQTPGPAGGQGVLNTGKGRGGINFKVWAEGEKEILPKMNLTKDQQDRVSDLDKKTAESIKTIHQENKGQKDVIRQKVQELTQNYRKSFFEILTPVQGKQYREDFRAFAKKWHDEHQKPATPPPAGTPPPAAGTPPPPAH